MEPQPASGPIEPRPSIPPVVVGPRSAWYLVSIVCLAALAFGVYAYLYEHHHGSIVTDMRNPGYGGASWGLYIVFDIFFVGVSFAGFAVTVLARLFDIDSLRPVTRIAQLLTLGCLIAAAACVMADQGRPFDALTKLPQLARPSSPFFGTFTMIEAGYLFSGVVLFFLDGRQDAAFLATKPGRLRWLYRLWASGFQDTAVQRGRHRRVTFWLSLGVLPLLIIAHATLGFVFGIQGGRPGWFSAHQAPAFVVLAGLSGTGMLILSALGLRWLFRLKDRMPDSSFRWLGNAMWIQAVVYLFFMIVETLTATYAAPEADRALAREIITGHFAPLFWLTVGNFLLAFVIPFQSFLRKKIDIPGLVIAAAIANVAAVSRRMLIVIPSQTHGALIQLERGTYSPTWVEYFPILGLACMVVLVLLFFGRLFPLVPSAHRPVPEGTPRADGWLRYLTSWTAIVLGVALIVVGLTDSFRLWSGGEVDNRIPFSPMIFAGGVMLLFASALIFEVLPERRRAS